MGKTYLLDTLKIIRCRKKCYFHVFIINLVTSEVLQNINFFKNYNNIKGNYIERESVDVSDFDDFDML